MSHRVGLRHIGRRLTTPRVEAFSVDLPVDALVDILTEWTRVGTAEPLLDSDDDDTNKVYTTSGTKREEYYTFADLAFTPLTITSVHLRFRIKYWTWASEIIRFYLWLAPSWRYVAWISGLHAAWRYYNIDVTSIMTTVARINAARTYFDAYLATSEGNCHITYACLRVAGTRAI